MKKTYLSISLCTCLIAQDTFTFENILVTSDISIETEAGVTKGYESLTEDSATKTRTSLKQIPKSIQVLN